MPHRRSSTATSSILTPNLMPLLDVVLQLITFFMMLVHFGTRLEGATKAVRLPVAPAALPGSELTFDRLGVAMNAQGQLLVEGRRSMTTLQRLGGPTRRRPAAPGSKRSASRRQPATIYRPS